MSNIKLFKPILLIISLFLITNCSNNNAMKPEDFKDKEPRLIIEEYLSGNVDDNASGDVEKYNAETGDSVDKAFSELLS